MSAAAQTTLTEVEVIIVCVLSSVIDGRSLSTIQVKSGAVRHEFKTPRLREEIRTIHSDEHGHGHRTTVAIKPVTR